MIQSRKIVLLTGGLYMRTSAWTGFILSIIANLILASGYIATGYQVGKGHDFSYAVPIFSWSLPYWAILLLSIIIALSFAEAGRVIGGDLNPQAFRPFKHWWIPTTCIVVGLGVAYS